MRGGLYTYDPEVVESRWRLHIGSFRYVAKSKARLYLTGAYGCLDWSLCDACRPVVLALRAIIDGRHGA